jgi:hypothetical protein
LVGGWQVQFCKKYQFIEHCLNIYPRPRYQ